MTRTIDVGALNKRVTLLKKVTEKDEAGQDRIAWKEERKLWATMKPFKSSEQKLMSKLTPDVSYRMYTRYTKGIEPDKRILYGKRLFQIAGWPVDLDEEHVMLEIQLEEAYENEQYGF